MFTKWKQHFNRYDLFHNNSDRYRQTIEYHADRLEGCPWVLDTGAGSGNLTLELLKRGHRVVAIDKNKYALRWLRKKCREYLRELQTREMLVERMDFYPDIFDGASSMFVIPFVQNIRAYFHGIYRALRKEGKFTLSAWAPVEDCHHGIVGSLEEELVQKGILPKHQKEWEYISETSRMAARMILKRRITPEKIEEQLENAGFIDIIPYFDNPYSEHACFFECVK